MTRIVHKRQVTILPPLKDIVEVRLNTEEVYNINDIVRYCTYNTSKSYYIEDIKVYKTFRKCLEAETVSKCLPVTLSLDDAIAIYNEFYHITTNSHQDIRALILRNVSYIGIY